MFHTFLLSFPGCLQVCGGGRWEMALVEEMRERREDKQTLKKWEKRERENKKRESLLYLSAFQFARHMFMEQCLGNTEE